MADAGLPPPSSCGALPPAPPAGSPAASASSTAAGLGGETAVLFERGVPVTLRLAERDGRVEGLTVRIGIAADPQSNQKALKVHLTSEDDAFFLHSLEVSEEDFQGLKAEQGILVDFATFPSKVVELLERCIHHGGEESPKFLAILSGHSHVDGARMPGESVLSIVEMNQFKQLNHIALRFRPGNDAAIKRHLATRLNETKARAARLAEQLRASEAANAEAAAGAEELQGHLRRKAAEEDALRSELSTTHAQALAVARADALKETIETKQRYEKEKAALEAHHRAVEQGLHRRVAELERENKALTERKFELDGRVSELSTKLGSADGELDMLREAKSKWAKEQKELEKAVRSGEKALAERDAKLASLQSQSTERDEQTKLLKTQLKQAESHLRSLEGSLEQTKVTAQKSVGAHESLMEEHSKATKNAETLAAESKSLKAKLKLKGAVIAQQENLLEERQAALTEALRKASALEASLADAKEREASSKAVADERKAKLEESQELLSSNQRLISWLNSQVNEAQLGRIGVPARASFGPTTLPVRAGAGAPAPAPAKPAAPAMSAGGAPPSRYAFRPSIAIPLAGK